jgi:short-subunit dehydrogenase
MNDWALITGASTGIGRELARVFAANHFNLVLVARSDHRLIQLAHELESARKIETRAVPTDLAQPNAATELFHKLDDIPISVLVNNAGFGSYGPFAETELRVQHEMMEVNMVTLVELTHLFLQLMLRRGSGRILNVASTAAFQPGPLVSIYYATKAFVYSFSYALSCELTGTGVSVTALCPGMTRTEFFERGGMRKRSWLMMEPQTVAEKGYRALMKGKRVVIPGAINQIMSFLARHAPHRLTSTIVKRIH